MTVSLSLLSITRRICQKASPAGSEKCKSLTSRGFPRPSQQVGTIRTKYVYTKGRGDNTVLRSNSTTTTE